MLTVRYRRPDASVREHIASKGEERRVANMEYARRSRARRIQERDHLTTTLAQREREIALLCEELRQARIQIEQLTQQLCERDEAAMWMVVSSETTHSTTEDEDEEGLDRMDLLDAMATTTMITAVSSDANWIDLIF